MATADTCHEAQSMRAIEAVAIDRRGQVLIEFTRPDETTATIPAVEIEPACFKPSLRQSPEGSTEEDSSFGAQHSTGTASLGRRRTAWPAVAGIWGQGQAVSPCGEPPNRSQDPR